MGFTCPQCGALQSLEITASICLLADSRSDEIIVQLIRCRECGFGGLATYEESRRGRLEAEAWEHTAYHVSAADLEKVAGLVAVCSDLANPACQCQAHQSLSQTTAQGRWSGLDGLEILETFQMNLV